MFQGLTLTGLAAICAAAPAFAQDTRITRDMARFETTLNGRALTIERNGPACPSKCLQPMQAASGIATIGELEVLDFLDSFASRGRGLLVDARLPEGFAAGTIPGAVNVPFATVQPDNPYRDDLLNALGVQGNDFSNAFSLVFFAGGADADEAPRALRSLLDAGYPAEKLSYYRGGLKSWLALGLTTVVGQ